jgi:hypothetical protein
MANPKVSKALEKIKKKKEAKEEEPEETPEETPEGEEEPDRISVINALQNAGVYRREVLIRLNDLMILQKETNEKLGKVIELLEA